MSDDSQQRWWLVAQVQPLDGVSKVSLDFVRELTVPEADSIRQANGLLNRLAAAAPYAKLFELFQQFQKAGISSDKKRSAQRLSIDMNRAATALSRVANNFPSDLRKDAAADFKEDSAEYQQIELLITEECAGPTFRILASIVHFEEGPFQAVGDRVAIHPSMFAAMAEILPGISKQVLLADVMYRGVIVAQRLIGRILKIYEPKIQSAGLTAQLRYGLTHLPDGSILQFDRRESLAQIFRKDAVSVRGLTTLRQWLRSPRSAKMARFVDLSTTSRRLDKSLPPLTLQDQLALLALSRATREPDPLAQVQALWEAVEFYVSGVEVGRMFSKAECRKIRKAVMDALPSATAEQHERLDHAIGQLNNAPLLIKLKAALDREGVPIADSELDLLWKLRQLRNDVVHGRNSTLPEPEDVEYAVSIIARMLLYRVLQG